MSFVVKKVIDENNFAARKRFADIGKIFSGAAGGDEACYCRQFLDVLRKWSQILRLPPLSCFGLTSADFEKIISLAENKSSPAVLSPQEIKVILEIVR